MKRIEICLDLERTQEKIEIIYSLLEDLKPLALSDSQQELLQKCYNLLDVIPCSFGFCDCNGWAAYDGNKDLFTF